MRTRHSENARTSASSEDGISADRRWMRLALSLARLGMGRTHPDPRVGAVAVRHGRVLGIGAHLFFGGPHAEAALFTAAAPPEKDLRGATLYVNLEPCAHHGKTPACAPEIARHGIARVVAAMEDPHPLVRGRGFECLATAGVDVRKGLLGHEARRVNAPFLWHLQTGRALLTLKIAASLDGRIAANDGTSRWISGQMSREWVHRRRAECDAIVIGRGTFLRDRPSLSARPSTDPRARLRRRIPQAAGEWPHQPARVVVDSRARTAELDDFAGERGEPARGEPARGGPGSAGGRWIVACGARAPEAAIARLERRGVACWRLPDSGNGSGVDLHALAKRLGDEGLLDVMIEGGAALASGFLAEGLVDRLRLFVAPSVLGGTNTWTGDLRIASLAGRLVLARMRARECGEDLLLSAESSALAALEAGEEE